jgi:hypothetical protein
MGDPSSLCDGARVLDAEGVDPATKLVMRHEGSPYDALRSTVGGGKADREHRQRR